MLWWTLRQLRSKDYDTRARAAQKLRSLGWQPGNDSERAQLAIAGNQWEEVVKLGTAAVAPLVAALSATDWSTRWNAMWALGQIGDARAVKPLGALLRNRDYYEGRTFQEAAARALGEIGDTSAVEPLLAMLKNEQEGLHMRIQAAWALGEIGDTRAVDPLMAVIKHRNDS